MILKLGSKGEDVKALQSKLGIAADGNFCPGMDVSLVNMDMSELEKMVIMWSGITMVLMPDLWLCQSCIG